MFGMGMNEVLIVMAIAVIVIGPRQLPQVARAMGKLMAQFKRATNDLRSAVNDEIGQHSDLNDLREMKDSLQNEIHNIRYDSTSYLEGEFEEERKIGEGIADDLKSAAEDIPTRDFEAAASSDTEDERLPADTEQEGGDGAEPEAAAPATPGEGEEQPGEPEEADKPRGNRYV